MSDGKTREDFPENQLQDGILRQRIAQKAHLEAYRWHSKCGITWTLDTEISAKLMLAKRDEEQAPSHITCREVKDKKKNLRDVHPSLTL